MDFKSYKDAKIAKIIDKTGIFENMPQEQQEGFSQFMSSYGGKNQGEIFNDFISAYKQEVEKGNMSKEKLRETVANMGSFLTPQQLATINTVINNLEK